MTIGVPNFYGERLIEARLARGLFKKSLGDLVGVSGTAITRHEEGQDRPQAAHLQALADHLNFPVEFFKRKPWAEKLEPIFWRSRTSETKSAREMTEQRMRWLCELFSFLNDEVNFPSYDLPQLDIPSDPRLITSDVVERVALKLRTHWGLGTLPIPDVVLALENAGIPVVTLEVESDKQDGFSFSSALLRRFFVGINVKGVSAARARFDAAHELGHAILHANIKPALARDVAFHNQLERQANRFAGAFLFPATSFANEVGVASLDYFCAIKRRWGMSIGAMVFRAADIGMIDEDEKRVLFQNMTRRRWRGPLGEPYDTPEEMPLERPRMLRRGVERVVEGGIFGRSQILDFFALPAQELEELAALDKNYLSKGSLVELVTSRVSTLRSVDLESGNILEFRRKGR